MAKSNAKSAMNTVMAKHTTGRERYYRCSRELREEPAGFELTDEELAIFEADPYIRIQKVSTPSGKGKSDDGGKAKEGDE